MPSRHIWPIVGAFLTVAFHLTPPAPLARAAVEQNRPASAIRFETPDDYCEISDVSPAQADLMARARQRGGRATVLVGLFADCEQKRDWQGDSTKELSRFGAAYVQETGDVSQPMTGGMRKSYLQILASRFAPWENPASKPM